MALQMPSSDAKHDSLLWYLHATLHRRPVRNIVVPALDLGKIFELHVMHFMAPYTGVGRNVCDRIFTGEKVALAKCLFQNGIKPQSLFMESLDGKWNFFFETIKIVGLPEHRSNSAHLKHEPLKNAVALTHIRRPELAGFFRQIHQNGSRFE